MNGYFRIIGLCVLCFIILTKYVCCWQQAVDYLLLINCRFTTTSNNKMKIVQLFDLVTNTINPPKKVKKILLVES